MADPYDSDVSTSSTMSSSSNTSTSARRAAVRSKLSGTNSAKTTLTKGKLLPTVLASKDSDTILEQKVNDDDNVQAEPVDTLDPALTDRTNDSYSSSNSIQSSEADASQITRLLATANNNISSSSIQVAVRIRPLNEREKKHSSNACLALNSNKTIAIDAGSSRLSRKLQSSASNVGHKEKQLFTYDYIYNDCGEVEGSSSITNTQESVFGDIGTQIINNAFQGYNCCLMAYGQTGSGQCCQSVKRNSVVSMLALIANCSRLPNAAVCFR